MVSNRHRLTVLLVAALFNGVAHGTGCAVALPQLPKELDPLYLKLDKKKGMTFFEPTGKVTPFDEGESVFLECPTPPKAATKGQKLKSVVYEEVTCNERHAFDSAVSKVQCPKRVDAVLRETDRTCEVTADGVHITGLFYEIGFNVENGDQFIKLYEVCYDQAVESVIFTHHEINGMAIGCECLESGAKFIIDMDTESFVHFS